MRGFLGALVVVLVSVAIGVGVLAIISSRTIRTASQSLLGSFTAAKAQWESQGMVGGGALQNVPFFLAMRDLKNGLSENGVDTTKYHSAITELADLTNLPDADVTPAENRIFLTNFRKLNTFFRERSNFECGVPTGSVPVDAAARAWETEPQGRSSDVKFAPMRAAVADLKQAMREDGSDADCYSAVIADLENLESVPESTILRSPRYTGLYSMEIAFVNYVLSVANGHEGYSGLMSD